MDNKSTVNSVVFYWNSRKSEMLSGHKIKDRIRYELHPGKTALEALDAAKPDKHEIVLNSVEIN